MSILLSFFIYLAAAGLILSAVVHVGSWFGAVPLGELSWSLHAGLFVVWFPAAISMIPRQAKGMFSASWKEAFILNPFKHRFFKGCPKWMITLTFGLFVYGLINFAVFMKNEEVASGQSIDMARQLRGFSGHWMIFYSMAMTLLYSAKQGKEKGN